MDVALPSLVWVIVDGAARHVSEFAHLPPRGRPVALCPHCDRRLTLKLGTVRRHHAAHDAGHHCPATHPETALHINCKLALASTLRAAAGTDARLSIVRQCAGASGDACDETLIIAWAHAWDDVFVERTVGHARRPDIVLSRDGAAIGAIEVLVSHAVSADKARALEQMDMPWIEIVADERLAQPGGWTPADPIAVRHTSAEREWRCSVHAERYALFVRATAEQRAAEREAQRRTVVLRAARVVDVYHDGGARERFIYRVGEQLVDGRPREVRLSRGGAIVLGVPVSSSEEARTAGWPLLRASFTADVERLARRKGSFADSPMRWAIGDAAENIVDEALTDFAGRDPTPLATRYPRRWFYAKDDERWFLPTDMRDVRWDRAALDAFASHPAWTRGRSAVRERPAPEGSWTTPVFASRPIAAMFRTGVRAVTHSDDGALAVIELATGERAARRAIVVLERATDAAMIAAMAARLEAERLDAFWISYPSDWCVEMAPLAWAPAGRDWRGHGVIVIDGLGIFRADQLARALLKGDRRLSGDEVRRRMQGRVERMSRG